jgi:leucyl-tRNA synthetase
MAVYDFLEIQKKWQKYWDDQDIYKVEVDPDKPKYYVLDMFPYPSGAGLHVGHPLGYIATDIVSRFKRLKGFNVLHPMGFDSFGLPAEQYAIQTGQHPAITTETNINRYKEQLRDLGFSYDWSREVRTSDPSYYKWTQWIFKQLFNAWYNKDEDKSEHIDSLIDSFKKDGNQYINAVCDDDTPSFTADEWNSLSEKEQADLLLKYRLTYLSETSVNWCPALGTVLSNDEVKDGFSERGGHPVIKKKMPQWSMRITAYADRLLSGLDTIDWPEPIKEMQRNWIGKSIGAEMDFAIEGHEQSIRVFTTRIDTIYGVTFMTLAPENELVEQITTDDQREAVRAYVAEAVNRSERERMSDVKHISGVFTGAYAINPFNNEKVPIWIADYVLAGYGTGAVMAVPSGDQRDYDFAKHFDLPIVPVYENMNIEEQADPTKEGKMINSGILNGLDYEAATEKAIQFLIDGGIGERKINYRIRDAIFGRQRYWGEPFPVYFKEGIPTLIDDKELPVVLPEVDKYLPTEDGEPPLARAENWKYGGQYDYEWTTMPGWAGSSWYFFRYMDPTNDEAFASPEALKYWKTVDLYTGGSEHATGHLLYSRFWTKFLYDLGYVDVQEYADKLINQGMIQGRSNFAYRVNGENTYVSNGLKDQYETTPIHVDVNIVKDDIMDIEAFKKFRSDASNAKFVLEGDKFVCGWEVEKMSKSKYNVVNPDELIQKYGADTLRMYEMFLGPIEQSKPWNTNGIEGVFKFLKRFHALFHNGDTLEISDKEPTKPELKVLHGLLKKVEEDVNSLSLNTSVSSFMIAVNELTSLKCNKRDILEPLTIALAPFAPFLAEELWHNLGHESSVVAASYPQFDETYLKEDEFEYPVSVNGKMRVKIKFPVDKPVKEIQDEVLDNEIVQKWLEGKAPKKIIVVPKRIVNVVV